VTTAACAFCGATVPTSAMDLTGHGWRCATCQLESQIAEARGTSNPMTEHLTRGEIEDIVIAGGREALGGAGLVLAGGLGTLVLSGGSVIVVLTGVIATGLGMIAHGLYRRKLAKHALRDAPVARVVR